MNALEQSIKKVDKENDGIITRDQCKFALNDATESKMTEDEVDALVLYHDRKNKGFIAAGVIQ